MIFIKDTALGKSTGFMPGYIDALEAFIPEWLDSLLPYYVEGKKNDVDVMGFRNVVQLGDSTDYSFYSSNGVDYCLDDNKGWGVKVLEFDSRVKSTTANWRELFFMKYPHYNDYHNRSVYDFAYFMRIANKKPENHIIADRCEQYFRQLTGDPNVQFSLSDTSAIIFKDKAKMFIDNVYKYD